MRFSWEREKGRIVMNCVVLTAISNLCLSNGAQRIDLYHPHPDHRPDREEKVSQ